MIEVYCRVQYEATHSWDSCNIEEVSYLKNEHRHVFYIVAYKKVNHANRDTEFIVLKHKIENFLRRTYPTRQLGSMSCEMLAEKLCERFDLSKCDVSEDNENGAVVYK